jgi:hypothetical protein
MNVGYMLLSFYTPQKEPGSGWNKAGRTPSPKSFPGNGRMGVEVKMS